MRGRAELDFLRVIIGRGAWAASMGSVGGFCCEDRGGALWLVYRAACGWREVTGAVVTAVLFLE